MHTTTHRTRRSVASRMSVLLVGLTAALAVAAPASASSKPVGAQLAEVRAATASFHDVGKALAAGYVPSDHCVADERGAAMGFHYVNFDLLFDGELDPMKPEILLYVPAENGGVRLVGAEYVSFVPGQTLFGQHLHGSPGGGPEALHVWLWQANPEGAFADFNRNLSC